MNNEWNCFWWEKVTGAQCLVDEVTTLLLNNMNTVLSVPFDFPWRHQMRDEIERKYKEQSIYSNIVRFYMVDVSDDCHNMSPGDCLLEKFSIGKIKNGYRTNSSLTIQEYIKSHKILTNIIVWIKGIPDGDTQIWIDFCSNYFSTSLSDGLFLLETHDDFNISSNASIKLVRFVDFINKYDVQVFNSFILNSNKRLSEIWKIYISTVVSTLCDIDAEISELLIRMINFYTDDPLNGIKLIANMPKYSKRGGQLDSQHVLSLYRNNRIDMLKYKIWTSQIQVLFPLIEIEKIEILGKFKESIENLLENHNTTQYGKEVDSISDIEIGLLSYMISKKKDNGDYLLYITDKSVRDRIHFLHECRNCLAHINCCTPQQVSQLLKNH